MIELPEHHLILLCARGREPDPEVRDRVSSLLRVGVDWGVLLDLAERQSVLPLVHRTLAAHFASEVPAEARAQAAARTLRFTGEGLRLTRVLLEVLDELRASGVQGIPFKGPSLALQAYGDVGLRGFADLDLLVRPSELPIARDALRRIGFATAYGLTPARYALLVREGSHEGFSRGDDTLVELHWRVASRPFQFGLEYESLWDRLSMMELAGREIPVLSSADLMILLCLHGNKHAWERLSWICDVSELLRAEREIDAGELLTRADAMRCRRVVLLGLRLARDLLGAELPPAVERAVSRDATLSTLAARTRSSLFQPPRRGQGSLGFHLATREGPRAKAKLILGSLTALNQLDLHDRHIPDPLTFLYYPARVVRLLMKATRHAIRSPDSN